MRSCIFILSFVITQVEAQTVNSKIDSLFAVWNKPMVPGVAIGVIQDGEWKYKKSFGLANLSKSIPIDDSTEFWIASVTKQFTALGIFLLESQGKLNLNNSIRRYMPTLPAVFEPVTIYHLLHHTSGMRDGFVLTALSKKPESEYTNANVLHFLQQQKESNFNPGTYFEYNNSGYVMLASVIETISGESYKEFMKNSVFTPLEMSNTYVSAKHPSSQIIAKGYHSTDYSNKPGTFEEGHFAGDTYGSTGIVTTLNDLGKWAAFIQSSSTGGKLAPLVANLLQKGKLNSGREIAYAGGLESFSFEGFSVYEHFGADEGFKANILYFPAKKLSIIGLSNNSTNYSLSNDLYKAASITLQLKENHQWTAIAPDKILWEQSYFTELPFPMYRKLNHYPGSVEMIEIPKGSATRYFPDKNYYRTKDPVQLVQLTLTKQQIEINDLYYSDVKRLNAIIPDSTIQDLISFAGNYKSPELETDYDIEADQGNLFLKFAPGVRFKLIRLTKEYFVFNYSGPNFIKIGKTGFLFSRDGIHDLYFAKQTN